MRVFFVVGVAAAFFVDELGAFFLRVLAGFLTADPIAFFVEMGAFVLRELVGFLAGDTFDFFVDEPGAFFLRELVGFLAADPVAFFAYDRLCDKPSAGARKLEGGAVGAVKAACSTTRRRADGMASRLSRPREDMFASALRLCPTRAWISGVRDPDRRVGW